MIKKLCYSEVASTGFKAMMLVADQTIALVGKTLALTVPARNLKQSIINCKSVNRVICLHHGPCPGFVEIRNEDADFGACNFF